MPKFLSLVLYSYPSDTIILASEFLLSTHIKSASFTVVLGLRGVPFSKTVQNEPSDNSIMIFFERKGIQLLAATIAAPSAIIVSQFVDSADSSKVKEIAFGSLNWLLGTNPISISYVSGHGENSIKGVYSNIYNNDGKPGIPNGYMSGGPNTYEGAELSNFAAKCYTTSTGDWVANEHTVYWNSALVFMAAYVNSFLEHSAFRVGDIDGNGDVDSLDFACLRQYLLGKTKSFPSENGESAADVDGSGTIDSLDLAYLKVYILGKISKFPAEDTL